MIEENNLEDADKAKEAHGKTLLKVVDDIGNIEEEDSQEEEDMQDEIILSSE